MIGLVELFIPNNNQLRKNRVGKWNTQQPTKKKYDTHIFGDACNSVLENVENRLK